jgi:hypothetical protein
VSSERSASDGERAVPDATDAPERLTIPFRDGKPQVYLGLEGPDGGTCHGWAIVDSGAHGSIFPLKWATDLGIRNALRKDPTRVEGAGGRRIKTWIQGSPVLGQLVQTELRSFWGPRISLTPSFAKIATPILGMTDFFPQFVVTIEAGPRGVLRLETRAP